MVISSNSKGLISGTEVVQGTSLAVARAGKTAALTPAKAPVCRKRRRGRELQFMAASSLSLKSGFSCSPSGHQQNGHYRSWLTRACQLASNQRFFRGRPDNSSPTFHYPQEYKCWAH